MAIYMKIDGIDGHVTAKGYEKWIELDSINFGLTRSISTQPGNVSDRENTKPTFSEIVVNKKVDQASPHIFTEACVGKAKPTVKIHLCKTGAGQVDPYMEYTLEHVLISNYQVQGQSANAQGQTVGAQSSMNTLVPETLNLNFSKIEMKYTAHDAKHEAGGAVPAGYDLTTSTKI